MYVQRKDLCVLVDCDKGEGHLTLVARCAEHSVGSSAVARRGAEDLHARALGLLQPFVDVAEQLLRRWKGAQYDVDVLVPPDADVAATPTRISCETFAACAAFVKSLPWGTAKADEVFEPRHDMCWCHGGGCAAGHPDQDNTGGEDFAVPKAGAASASSSTSGTSSVAISSPSGTRRSMAQSL